ncbi:hypothetical protein ACQ4PT_003177 [Festuca glaucescens]
MELETNQLVGDGWQISYRHWGARQPSPATNTTLLRASDLTMCLYPIAEARASQQLIVWIHHEVQPTTSKPYTGRGTDRDRTNRTGPMATLTVPAGVPPVAEDCEQLRKAFTGWGTNEKLIIDILAHRDAAQRRAIRAAYAETYGEELLRALNDEIHGKFERAVIQWTLDPAERDAVLANEEAKKWHAGGRALVEIACTRTPAQLWAAKQAYHDRFKRSLEEDTYRVQFQND